MTTTAVVILNYNGASFLQQFLPTVLRHSPEAEVIVADNCSTDGSLAYLHAHHPTVRVITLEHNYGFCGGYNRALAQVEADYYVLLNSDIEVTAGWLGPLIALLDGNASIQALQPKILAYANRARFEYAGAAGGFIDRLGYPFCRGRLFTYAEEDHGQYNDVREVFWATGACLMIRSVAYRQHGGLDEDFFAHMEEIDLCWKINRAGGKVYYCGQSTVYHVGAGTLSYGSPRKTYLNFRNGLTMLLKHYDGRELLLKLPFRLFLDWVAANVFILSGQFSQALAVWRAHLHFIGGAAHTWRKRRKITLEHPRYSRANVYKGLIIADYYLRRKRTIDGL
jgi:GT2 family glycosyltransferase